MKVTVLVRVTRGKCLPELLELEYDTVIFDYSRADDLKKEFLSLEFAGIKRGVYRKDNVVYYKHESIYANECFKYIQGNPSDVVVFVDDDVVALQEGWLDEILKPFEDDNVKFAYCDFMSNGVPVFHTTLPSRVKKMPLCAFRPSVVEQYTPDFIELMSGRVMSRYIPETLVEIDDPI